MVAAGLYTHNEQNICLNCVHIMILNFDNYSFSNSRFTFLLSASTTSLHNSAKYVWLFTYLYSCYRCGQLDLLKRKKRWYLGVCRVVFFYAKNCWVFLRKSLCNVRQQLNNNSIFKNITKHVENAFWKNYQNFEWLPGNCSELKSMFWMEVYPSSLLSQISLQHDSCD